MKKHLLLAASLLISSLSWAQAPKADLLDVQFNADGTATDVSAMGNTVETYGTPTVVQSKTYGMNVFCAKQNTWFKIPTAAYAVQFTDAMKTAIEDGFSMELLIRPFWETDAMPSSSWGDAVGWEDGGGSSFLADGGKFYFETHTGGAYHDAPWSAAPQQEWTHMVGVWNKEDGKSYFYVNGELAGTADAGGDYDWPNKDVLKAYIGADFLNSDGPEASVPGDYAIVRFYSDPMTADQAAALYNEVKAKDTGAEEHNDKPETVEIQKDADGNWLISTADQLKEFGRQTKLGNKVNVKLTSDIDYSGINDNLSSDSWPYYGTFDGQGHTIKIDMTLDHSDSGLFDYLGNGCYIHDLHVDGPMHAVSDWSGVLFGDDEGATIEDVLITSDFYTTDDDNTMGSLLGGYCKNSPTYRNVVVIGSVNADVATACSGLVADVKADNLTMENCVSICSINNVNNNDCGPIMSRVRSGYKMTCKNVYYVNVNNADYGDIYEGVSEITMEDVRSGRITAMLAGTDPNTPWRQTLGEDDYPTMDKSHGYLLACGDSYVCVSLDNMASSLNEFADAANEYIENAEANESLKANLQASIETLTSSQSMDEFYANYDAYLAANQAVVDNVKAYVTFKQTVDNALVTLGDLQGSVAQELRDYLTDEIEPNDTYANGSANYIIQNKTLTNEGLEAESEFIRDMLMRVAATSAEAGTDVTTLLTNADFSQKEKGWNGTTANNYNANPAAAEFLSKNNCKMYQSFTGLKDGIYELDMNGLFCAANDKLNAASFTSIYANDVEVPVMSVIEGKLPFENAEDGVNSYCTDPDNEPYDMIVDEMYFVPQSTQGGAIALNGGRYLNRVLCNVSGGSLTIGANMYGSGNANDWLMLANTKLTYQGTVAEAGDALTNVLGGMVDRAKTLIAYEASGSGNEYLYYPNCSAATKAALQTCIDEAAAASDNDTKYQLIQKMSPLFQQAYSERMAYRNLATTLEWYYGCISEFESIAATIEATYSAGWDGWVEGKYSAQEAIDLTNTLKKAFESFAEDAPAADVLDVVFNADGTATDVSASQHEIVLEGSPIVKHSNALNMNVFCSAKTTIWGKTPQNAYRVHMTDEMWSKISDGVTYEAYVRPYSHGSDWVGIIGYEEGGGIGLITDAQKWCMEAHIGGGYKEAYGTEPVDGEWIHLVGVWDKEAGSLRLYINGTKVAETGGVGGDLDKPNIGSAINDMFIGCDIQGSNGSPQSAFAGDIAIARIYDQPLKGSQVLKLWSNIMDLNTGAAEHDEEAEDAVRGIEITSAAAQSIFNLMGQKLQKAQRGINIINGKKVLVK